MIAQQKLSVFFFKRNIFNKKAATEYVHTKRINTRTEVKAKWNNEWVKQISTGTKCNFFTKRLFRGKESKLIRKLAHSSSLNRKLHRNIRKNKVTLSHDPPGGVVDKAAQQQALPSCPAVNQKRQRKVANQSQVLQIQPDKHFVPPGSTTHLS